MDISIKRFASIATMLVYWTNISSANVPLKDEQLTLKQLVNDVANDRVDGFDVFAIPLDAEFYSATTPQQLERDRFKCRISFQHLEGNSWKLRGLLNAMKSVETGPASGSSDLRVGMVFYSETLTRLGAIYFDRFGSHGYIGEDPVVISGDLFSWLNRLTKNCALPNVTDTKHSS